MGMADNKTADLPEGTDKVIAGASGSSATTLVPKRVTDEDADSGLADRIRRGTENLSSQAGEKARGLVGQGLERSAEALGNVAKLVGDTAPGIEERLGPDYGDFARRAASAIENAANTIAEKDPDELIEDTRQFVRNSPGIALAGAAVVGFVLARLLKTGLSDDEDDDDDDED
jgi:ElaB/YqjD/DUF883 family membrane-anchored ribosome-binding protein